LAVLVISCIGTALAQTGDKLLEQCIKQNLKAAEKSHCKRTLIGRSHEFSGRVVDFIGHNELKLDHSSGFFSHIHLMASFSTKTPATIRQDDTIVIIGTVESIFDDALNPSITIKSAKLK